MRGSTHQAAFSIGCRESYGAQAGEIRGEMPSDVVLLEKIGKGWKRETLLLFLVSSLYLFLLFCLSVLFVLFNLETPSGYFLHVF